MAEDIREKNAKDLKEAWKKFLKGQERKNAGSGKQGNVLDAADKIRR